MRWHYDPDDPESNDYFDAAEPVLGALIIAVFCGYLLWRLLG